MNFLDYHSSAFGFIACLLGNLVVTLTMRWHSHFTADATAGIQKVHVSVVPRVGGLPILLAVVLACSMASTETRKILTPLLFASLPAFLFGLAEDLTKNISVVNRLLATMFSSVLAWLLTDISLTGVDVIGLDWIIKYTLFSVLFTAIAVGGVANAINIIDGFNGLASTTTILAFLSYAMIAYQVNDMPLVATALILASSVFGFFLLNWPFGKIFLGDGGAYFLGFSIAWVAVLLLERNPTVSAFATLMVCCYPVTDVLFSVYRRLVKKANLGHPDRSHFHSLFKRRYVSRWLSKHSLLTRNSVTGISVGFMTLFAGILANITYNSVLLSATGFFLLVMGYIFFYARMVKHKWYSPINFLTKT